jgi:hypothetical protein
MILLNRQTGSKYGHYLIENSQGNNAEQTPSNSPLLYNNTLFHAGIATWRTYR